MHELTALELGIVVKELREKIEGGFLKKFYDLGSGTFRFSFYKNGVNTVVYCKLCVTLNETKFSEEAGPATPFAMAVRKRIEGAKVRGFEQYGSDRIITMQLDDYRLIIEMFGKGNLIVTDTNNKIELVYKALTYRDRTLKPKATYVFPASDFVNPDLAAGDIDGILKEVEASDDKVIVSLSRHLNFGPIYLEEILKRCDIDPKGKARGSDTILLRGSILGFLDEISRYRPRIYELEEGREYAVLGLSKYKEAKFTAYESMNSMLDNLYIGQRSTIEDKSRKVMEEMDANIGKQADLLKRLKEESLTYAASGNKVFEHMNEINALVGYMRQNRHAAINEVRAKFPELKVTNIDLKNKIVSIDIE